MTNNELWQNIVTIVGDVINITQASATGKKRKKFILTRKVRRSSFDDSHANSR